MTPPEMPHRLPHRIDELGLPVGLPVPDWCPCPRPPATPMAGRWATVLPLDPAAHGPGLYRAFAADQEGRIWAYLPYGPFRTEAAFLAWMAKTCTGPDPMFHAILDNATGEPVGLASYLRIDPGNGVTEVGHLNFAPRLQRTPHATEAMFLMMRRAFDELGYRRYEWKCDALNARSCRAALRLGFSFEGVFRRAVVAKGRNRDTAWYAMTATDWPGIRAAFTAWLDAVAAAPDGRQPFPLAAELAARAALAAEHAAWGR